MRIVFYSHISNLGNGGVESLLALVSQISKTHDCIVITPSTGDFNEELTNRDVKNFDLKFNWSSRRNNKFDFKFSKKTIKLIIDWIKNYKEIRLQARRHAKKLRDLNPDIIYTNTSVINIGYFVAKELNIPHLWHLREFPDNEFKPDFGFWFFKNLLSKSNAVVVNSGILKRFYQKVVSRNKINLIYNGITIRKSFPKNSIGKPYKFLVVGELVENKGQKKAVLAAKKLFEEGCEFKLDIVGSGKLKEELESLIKEFNLRDVITLQGFTLNVSEYYEQADCYLMCSEKEAFGRVTVEAMLHQLPIIYKKSEFNASKEIVRSNIDGIFYENDTDLYLKMRYMLNNKELGFQMGKNAKERAETVFSLSKSVSQLEKVIQSLI